jgi:hypothetical protein
VTAKDVLEREKAKKMEGPEIPNLPFELPKVNRGGGDSTDASKE